MKIFTRYILQEIVSLFLICLFAFTCILITLKMTHQDLANMVGSCRETISRTFNQLVRRGLITPRGRGLEITRRLVAMTGPTRAPS